MTAKYPQHEALRACAIRKTIVAEFLEWLQDNRIELAKRDPDSQLGHFERIGWPIRTVLAQYFGIDEQELENEKLAMLEGIRDSQ